METARVWTRRAGCCSCVTDHMYGELDGTWNLAAGSKSSSDRGSGDRNPCSCSLWTQTGQLKQM